MPSKRKIEVIDMTIREGMQFRGLVFSESERRKILDFQAELSVDICQAGYPPAHKSELDAVKDIVQYGQSKNYKTKVAALSRSFASDITEMIKTGINDFHLHTIITKDAMQQKDPKSIFASLKESIDLIRENKEESIIGISLLDVGRTEDNLLKECAEFLSKDLKVDILSLPDTSGIMTPDDFGRKVSMIKSAVSDHTKIGIHCHNDLGFAAANTISGVLSGGDVVEVSALGIGERNGIGDLFIVGKILKDKGFELNLKTSKTDTFKDYYMYVNNICQKKTGYSILNYNTPFFGESLKTHVAGTHADSSFGISDDEEFFINTLCGKNLVKKVLEKNNIKYDSENLSEIVKKIKDLSAKKERSLSIDEIRNVSYLL